MVLLDLFSAVGDELSDYQDRVMNEAYLTTARKRVSLARHARLMDYYIYEGNQASTWMAVTAAAGTTTLAARAAFFSGDAPDDPDAVVFLVAAPTVLDSRVNALDLYTWSDTAPALGAGETSADLAMPDQATANAVRDLVRAGTITQLLVQEHLNPGTGTAVDVDPTHRQLLRLLTGDDDSQVLQDPLTSSWLLRVSWKSEDQLQRDYCFTITRDDGTHVPEVSRFHGNLVAVEQGAPRSVTFKAPGAVSSDPAAISYELTDPPTGRWGTLCAPARICRRSCIGRRDRAVKRRRRPRWWYRSSSPRWVCPRSGPRCRAWCTATMPRPCSWSRPTSCAAA